MRRLFFLFLLIVVTVNGQTKLTAEQATALQQKVKARAAETKTITSDFTQYKRLQVLNNDVVSNGILAYQKPGLIKWEYQKPNTYSVLFKGDKLYINDNGKKNDVNLGKNKRFQQLNKLIAGSITGDMFITDEFEIFYFKNGKGNEAHFKPKDKRFGKFIAKFVLVFSVEGDVDVVKMIEPSGDYTKIIFSNSVTNKSIDASVFSQ